MNCFHRFLLWILIHIYPYKTYGTENVPDGAAVIPYNHFSIMDPLFIRHAYKGDICFPAKIELFRHRIIGGLVKACGAIPVDRENPTIDTMLTSIRALKSGNKLVISPEGTRNKTGSLEFLPFKPGTVYFALKGRAPIVPCIVDRPAKPFRKTRLYFAKPIDLSDYYDKKLSKEEMQELNDIFVNKMREAQTEFLDFLKNKKRNKRKKSKNNEKI